MSLPRYPLYRDSGVEWIGDVPAHWTISLLKRAFAHVDYGISEPLNLEGSVAVLRMGNIERGRVIFDDLKYVDCVDAQLLLDQGDLLFNRTNSLDQIGKVGLLEEPTEHPVTFASYLVRLRLIGSCSPAFLSFLLNSAGVLGEARARAFVAIGQCNLNPTRYGEIAVPLPPLPEQSAIAAFLDRDAGKIDALVDEQRRLIELLKEKRQAVISHAVTKGLDPTAPVKNTGLEWLGEVPAHWDVTQLKRLCAKITDGAHVSPEVENGTHSFVSTKDILADSIDFEGCLLTSSESYEYLVRSGCQPEVGDVLFSKDGTIGRTVVISEHRDFVVASSLIIIRPNPEQLDPQFLNYLCQSAAVQGQVESFAKGAGLPRLSVQNLLKVVGTCPPLAEQASIVASLSRLIAAFDDLVSSAEAAVTLLRERRGAVISAAVTGKIDVRELAEARAA